MLSCFRQARAAGALLLAASALWLAGCATLAPATTPEEVVVQRSQERWDALLKGDFARAWTYAPPSVRAEVKQGDYKKRFGTAGKWKSVQIEKVTCEPETCIVRVLVVTELAVPGFKGKDLKSTVDEAWVRDDGQWWFREP